MLMRIAILIALVVTLPFAAAATTIKAQCVSMSGKATYFVHFDIAQKVGMIRYQFFGQDVIYDVYNMDHEGQIVRGLAVFKSSGDVPSRVEICSAGMAG
jgi:hypothetical protein